MDSVANSVLKRIRVHGRGWVFTPRDFLALGTRRAVDRALVRLTQDKTIRRLAQGLYDYPRVHKKLGILAPNPDDVPRYWQRRREAGSRYRARARRTCWGSPTKSPRSWCISPTALPIASRWAPKPFS